MGWTAAPAAKGRSRPPMTPLLGPRPAPRLPRRCATSLVLLTFAILSCYASAACAGEACRLPGVPIVARVGLGAESCAAAGASRRVRSGGSGDPASSSSEDVVPFRRLVDASPAPVPSPTAASTPAPSPTLLPSAASPTPTTPPDCPMVVAYTAFDKIDSTQNVLPDSEMFGMLAVFDKRPKNTPLLHSWGLSWVFQGGETFKPQGSLLDNARAVDGKNDSTVILLNQLRNATAAGPGTTPTPSPDPTQQPLTLDSPARQQLIKFSATKGPLDALGFKIKPVKDMVFNNLYCRPMIAGTEDDGGQSTGLPCEYPTGAVEASYMPVELVKQPYASQPGPGFTQMIVSVSNVGEQPVNINGLEFDYYFGGASDESDPASSHVFCMDFQASPFLGGCDRGFSFNVTAAPPGSGPGARFKLSASFTRTDIFQAEGLPDPVLLPQSQTQKIEASPDAVNAIQAYMKNPSQQTLVAALTALCKAAGIKQSDCKPWVLNMRVILSIESKDHHPMNTPEDYSFLNTTTVTDPATKALFDAQGIVARVQAKNSHIPVYYQNSANATTLGWGQTPGHRSCDSSKVPPGYVCPRPNPSPEEKPQCFIQVDNCCSGAQPLSVDVPADWAPLQAARAVSQPLPVPASVPAPTPGHPAPAVQQSHLRRSKVAAISASAICSVVAAVVVGVLLFCWRHRRRTAGASRRGTGGKGRPGLTLGSNGREVRGKGSDADLCGGGYESAHSGAPTPDSKAVRLWEASSSGISGPGFFIPGGATWYGTQESFGLNTGGRRALGPVPHLQPSMTESGLTHSTVQDLPNFDRAKLRLAVVPETGGSAGMPYKPESDTPTTATTGMGGTRATSSSATSHCASGGLRSTGMRADVSVVELRMPTPAAEASGVKSPGPAGAETPTHGDLFLRPPALVGGQARATAGDRGLALQASVKRVAFEHITREKLLGKGAYGEVWQGYWHNEATGEDQAVAVKMISPDAGVQADELVRSIEQELLLLTTLSHPRIVKCFGGNLEPTPFIVMELMGRGSLDRLIHPPGDERVRLSYASTLSLCLDVATALSYLHPSGIVHRDLKPHNILIDAEGHAKLADFGIAKIRDPDATMTKFLLTKNDGTPFYMAPEVLQSKRITEKCDIYSLGIVLLECFSGCRPWHELSDAFQVVFKVCVEHARPPIPDDTPRQLRRLLERMMHANPLYRPSAPDIVLEVSRLMQDLDRPADTASQAALDTTAEIQPGDDGEWHGQDGERASAVEGADAKGDEMEGQGDTGARDVAHGDVK